MTYPCYKMYTDAKGEWRWTYYAKNAEKIAVSSEGYKAKADCRRGIDLMKGSTNDPVYEG